MEEDAATSTESDFAGRGGSIWRLEPVSSGRLCPSTLLKGQSPLSDTIVKHCRAAGPNADAGGNCDRM